MKAVFLDAGTLPGVDWSAFPIECSLVHYQQTPKGLVIPRLCDAEIVITNKVALDAEQLAQLPQLRCICVAATGVNHIDIAAATKHGIVVCNARDYATHAVAQHVFALLLALTNQIISNQRAIAQGEWSRSPSFCLLNHPIRPLHGLTLTILGYGTLGQATAKLASAFGLNICIAERPDATTIRPGRTAFHQALATADIVSLHCPASSQQFLLGAHELSLLKPSALLINTARGQLIDPEALAEALRQRRLAGAALDVLMVEPPALDDVLLGTDIPNLILSPHVAWASADSMQNLTNQVIENLSNFLQNTPIRVCNAHDPQ